MGQAKRRGSYEERKTEAIKLQKEREKINRLNEIERINNMSPEDREKLRKQKEAFLYFSSIIGMNEL